jgi:hypothetical protein
MAGSCVSRKFDHARVRVGSCSTEEGLPVVDRSTTGSNSGDPGGQSVDRGAAHGTDLDAVDGLKHLAKVRVDRRFGRPMSRKAGPGGPAYFILVLGRLPTRQGSLRDSAALRVLVRLTATLDASRLSTTEALERSTVARDPRATYR